MTGTQVTGRIAVVFICLLTAGAGIAPGQDRQAQEGREAQRLWEEAVKAKGGREKLHGVSSLYVATEQPEGDLVYEFFVFPGRAYTYLYGAKRKDTVVDIYNGEAGVSWWQPRPHPAQLIRLKPGHENDMAIRRAQFTLLLTTRWLEPKPLRARKAWLGLKRVDVVETDAGGWRVDYYLDPKSRLPVKVVSATSAVSRAEGLMNYEVSLGDYEEIDGIQMPRKITHKQIFSYTQKWDERISRYEFNPGFDEKVFERAPSAETGPEAWRGPKP